MVPKEHATVLKRRLESQHSHTLTLFFSRAINTGQQTPV